MLAIVYKHCLICMHAINNSFILVHVQKPVCQEIQYFLVQLTAQNYDRRIMFHSITLVIFNL